MNPTPAEGGSVRAGRGGIRKKGRGAVRTEKQEETDEVKP